jgi:LL-diaminopimelate aminotransferase
LNYPNNPTGACATLALFKQAVDLANQHGFVVCHDAAYMQVAYDGERPPSLLQVPGSKAVAVEFNTLSKSHNMAGWRTGALLGSPEVIRTAFILKTNADSSHFLPIFEASTAALQGDQSWLAERNEIYRERRDAVLVGLVAAGLRPYRPRASIYVWSPIPLGWKSEVFVIEALENTGVSLTPGTIFGKGGEGFVRIALCAPLETIQAGMQRLGDWISSSPKP